MERFWCCQGLKAQQNSTECRRLKERYGAGGGSRTLTGLLSPADFLTDYGFRRPDKFRLSGLRSGLSLHHTPEDPGLRCRPSSLYTFPAAFLPGLARDCLVIEVPPILSSSTSPVSQRALKFS